MMMHKKVRRSGASHARKLLFTASALVALGVLGSAAKATPSFTVLYASGGTSGNYKTAPTTGSLGGTGFSVTLLGDSASETSDFSSTIGGSLQVKNNTAAVKSIQLVILGTGFNEPTAMPGILLFSNDLGGSATSPGSNDKISQRACAGPSAPTVNSNVTALCGTNDANNGPMGGNITPSYNFSSDTLVSSLGAPYNLYMILTIQLAGGHSTGFSDTASLKVPEPASLALLGGGLLGVGSFARRKRRSA